MNNPDSSPLRHRVRFDVEASFENQVRLLAAKWNVRTNVAVQRAVEQANTRPWSEDEKTLLKIVAVRTEEILRLLMPE